MTKKIIFNLAVLVLILISTTNCNAVLKDIIKNSNLSDGELEITEWTKHHIGDLPKKSMFILPGDLDGDGDKDIVVGGHWWENPGSASGYWQQHTIGEPLRNMALLQDFDGDGDIDIVGTEGIGAKTNHQFVWAKNDGKGSFTIMNNIDSCVAGDFVQGAAPITVKGKNYIAISWHKYGEGNYLLHIPKNPSSTQWTFSKISNVTQKEDISVGDIDRDGDDDLLLGTIWLENQDGTWVDHTIGDVNDFGEYAQPDRNDLADINGDGRLDAVVALEKGKNILWFKAPEDPTQLWERNSVGYSKGQGFSMDVADFDNDGDIDVVVGEHRGRPNNNSVFIFQNFDSGRTWSRLTSDSAPSDSIDHHDGTVAVDIDNDGDIDIISIGWYNPKVWIIENKAK